MIVVDFPQELIIVTRLSLWTEKIQKLLRLSDGFRGNYDFGVKQNYLCKAGYEWVLTLWYEQLMFGLVSGGIACR